MPGSRGWWFGQMGCGSWFMLVIQGKIIQLIIQGNYTANLYSIKYRRVDFYIASSLYATILYCTALYYAAFSFLFPLFS